MQLLRANTAVDVLLGPFLDSTNGNDTEEGLTIEDEHVLLSKLGQGLTAKNESTNAGHDDLGYYNCPLDTTDTNTEGTLDICCHMSGALTVKLSFMVLSEAAWDSMFAAKDAGFMDVNIKSIGRADTQETEANNLESACANYSVTRGLTGTAVPAVAADAAGGLAVSVAGSLDLDEISAILTDTGTTLDALIKDIPTVAEFEARSIVSADYTIVADLGTVQSGDSYAIVNGTHGLVSIQDDVDEILTDTSSTLDALIKDIPTVAEFEARTIVSADYTVVGDTIAAVTTVNGLAANVITATSINADAITAAKVAADVHTESATAVWASSNATLTKAYGLIMEQIYQFLMNDMNITDATGAVALRNLANDGDEATWGITDNDTTTARTDAVWV